MQEEEEPAPVATGSLAEILTGGLPQLLLGPAGKALSRLVGASVEIPAAWLEQRAQAIRDETAAKSAVMRTLSEASGQAGVADAALLQRGLSALLGKAYREQSNKEAVAAKTYAELSDDPPPSDSPGPSDDWMNLFEEHAARASSSELQDIWSRILAVEIRRPTSFSRATLQFIALLDQDVARAVEFALSFVVEGRFLMLERASSEDYKMLHMAQSAGIMMSLNADASLTRTVGTSGYSIFRVADRAVIAFGNEGLKLSLQLTALSRVGVELVDVLRVPGSPSTLLNVVHQLKVIDGVNKVMTGQYHMEGGVINGYNFVET